MFVSLAPFEQFIDDSVGPCWCPPAGVSALIDLVPPGRDSDPNVNFGLMLSESPLSSAHCTFGNGDIREIPTSGGMYDAWESITGRRPTQGLMHLSELLVDHLTHQADPTGQDAARPLVCGRGRQLEICLGEQIWSRTLTGVHDEFARPVMLAEAETLASIYRDAGETQYRLALGAIHQKYSFTGPVSHLIEWLFPDGREDLPLLPELWPQTTNTENWPNTGGTGVITSGQNFTWTSALGTWTVPSAGIARAAASSRARMVYTFGSNDFLATFVIKSSSGPGSVARLNSGFTDFYLALTVGGDAGRLFSFVSGTSTQINSPAGTVSLNDVVGISVVGSTIKWMKNGVATATVTNTAIASGSFCGLYNSANGSSDYGQTVFDDLVIGGGSNRRRRVICGGM